MLTRTWNKVIQYKLNLFSTSFRANKLYNANIYTYYSILKLLSQNIIHPPPCHSSFVSIFPGALPLSLSLLLTIHLPKCHNYKNNSSAFVPLHTYYISEYQPAQLCTCINRSGIAGERRAYVRAYLFGCCEEMPACESKIHTIRFICAT